MALCRDLPGENIKPTSIAEVRALVGKRVQYLRKCDYDKSGRGYIFPRIGTVTGGMGKQIVFDDSDYTYYLDIVEMTEDLGTRAKTKGKS